MKNLQIGDKDLWGRRFNGFDLHLSLRQRGIESNHVVWTKTSEDEHTHVLCGNDPRREALLETLAGYEADLGLHSVLYPFAYSLLNSNQFLNADIVHYHLVHNYFFDINLFPLLTKLKPSVWTLHDPWVLTGHCVHPFQCERWKTGCGECGDLGTPFAIPRDTSALYWEIKRDLFQRMQMDVIVSSRWMQKLVEQSPLMSNFKVHRIPFGVDLQKFSPGDGQEAKQRLGIPEKNAVICFRAQPSPYKGLEDVKQCLRQLKSKDPITLLAVVQWGSLDEFRSRFQVIDMGFIEDESVMRNVYSAADVFLMPSAAESFGMMAMEAMASGKPVIVYDGTPLPETIFAPQGGISVPQGDVKALTHELESLLANPEKQRMLGQQARKLAERHYDAENYVSRVLDVYGEVIAKRKIDTRVRYLLAQQKKHAVDIPLIAVKPPSSSIGQPIVPGELPTAIQRELKEFDLLKSSLYFKIYRRLRDRKQARILYKYLVKPSILFTWKTINKGRSLVRRVRSGVFFIAAKREENRSTAPTEKVPVPTAPTIVAQPEPETLKIHRYGCHSLGTAIHFNPREILHCGCPPSTIALPKVCDFSGGNFPLERYRQSLEELIEKNQREDAPCKGCPHLVKGYYTPFSAFSTLTINNFQTCNVSCIYCDNPNERQIYSMVPILRDLQEKKLISSKTTVGWGGGEPTISLDFEDMMKLINKIEMKQFLNTSGVKFSESVAEGMKKYMVTAQISVDSGTDETYAQIKRRNKASEVWNTISKYAQANRDNLLIKYIILDINSSKKEFRQFVERCKANNVKNVCISPEAYSCWKKTIPDHLLDAAAELLVMTREAGLESKLYDGLYGPCYIRLIEERAERLLAESEGTSHNMESCKKAA